MTEREPKNCIICGNEFVPRTVRQIICSDPKCKKARHNYITQRNHRKDYQEYLEKKRQYNRETRHPEQYKRKPDTIVAIGYAERQMAKTLESVGKIKTEL